MYDPAGFGEAGERSYPGRCNPHAWLKSGAIQPAEWYPFPRAEIFAPPGPGSLSPARCFAASPIRQPLTTSSKPHSIPFVEVPFKATVRRIEHHMQGFAFAFKRIGSESFVGDIHFSAGESVVADNPGYIDKMAVRSITGSYDAPGRGYSSARVSVGMVRATSKKADTNQLRCIEGQTKAYRRKNDQEKK
jgi:hypothetical protein